MGGGYKPPSGDSVEPLIGAISDLRRQAKDLQRPGGTRLGRLVERVEAALVNINTTVIAAISLNSYTKTEIDGRISAPPYPVAISGTVSATGVATFDAGVSSADVRSRVLTSGFANQYVDGGGRMGTVPSGIQYKQDVEPADVDDLVEALRTVALVRFRYIQAVEELGEDAPYLLGSIAQYFVAAGLGEWVTFDQDGEADGIAWERLTIPLLAGFQSLDRRLSALEASQHS